MRETIVINNKKYRVEKGLMSPVSSESLKREEIERRHANLINKMLSNSRTPLYDPIELLGNISSKHLIGALKRKGVEPASSEEMRSFISIFPVYKNRLPMATFAFDLISNEIEIITLQKEAGVQKKRFRKKEGYVFEKGTWILTKKIPQMTEVFLAELIKETDLFTVLQLIKEKKFKLAEPEEVCSFFMDNEPDFPVATFRQLFGDKIWEWEIVLLEQGNFARFTIEDEGCESEYFFEKGTRFLVKKER